VSKAMQPWIEEKFANPHSPSRWGHEAAAAIENARKQVEKAIGLKGGSVAFTGSATEAINWALKGTVEKAPKGHNRIITVATEHAAVLDTCEWLASQGADLTVLPVKANGRLDLSLLERELDERVLLVAVMMVNNEIGVTQPISEISEMVHKAGGLMLCDAVQAFGRFELWEGPDLPLFFGCAQRQLAIADNVLNQAGHRLSRFAVLDSRHLLQIQLRDQSPMNIGFELFEIQLFHLLSIPHDSSKQTEPLFFPWKLRLAGCRPCHLG